MCTAFYILASFLRMMFATVSIKLSLHQHCQICCQDALSAEINNLGIHYGKDLMEKPLGMSNEMKNNSSPTYVDREQFLRWEKFKAATIKAMDFELFIKGQKIWSNGFFSHSCTIEHLLCLLLVVYFFLHCSNRVYFPIISSLPSSILLIYFFG